jgi:multiple sugar transport system substrate-binding protein
MIPAENLDLSRFGDQAFLQVRHRQLDWSTGWNSILQIGLYQKGPDVSEVGSTWLENLNEMRALRPFSVSEINALGGENAFLAAARPRERTAPTVMMKPSQDIPGRRTLASIPWIVDTRLIHFRRDIMAKAGVSEAGAFSSPEAFVDTLQRLQASGIEYPLTMATGGLTLHNLACFIWGRGGAFRSADYRKMSITEPESRRGMVDYFKLHRFIHPEVRRQGYAGADNAFFNGQAAVLLSGQWVTETVKELNRPLHEEVARGYGCAMPPGVPYVGGTHLVVWRHTLHDQDSLRLLAHLTSPEVLMKIFHNSGNFPARSAVLESTPFNTDSDYQRVIDCIRIGRSFRTAHLWAGVEMRLSALCDQLWEDLFANPELDLEGEIERRTSELAARLEKTLLASW